MKQIKIRNKNYRIREGSIADFVITNKVAIGVVAILLTVFGSFYLASLAFGSEKPAEVPQVEKSLLKTKTEPVAVIWDVPLDKDLQLFIADLCEEYHMEPELVLAVIGQESNFNAHAIGDGGDSLGLMQVQTKWHSDVMQQLECDDLLDPYQNVTVGVTILKDLLDKGTLEWALMAYNGGETYANQKLMTGQISDYAEAVILLTEELKGV